MVSSSRVFRTVTGFFSACLAVILLFNQSSAATLRSFTLTYDVDLQSARTQLPIINEWRQSGTATYKDKNGNDVNCGVLKAYTYDYTLEQIALQRAYEVAVKFDHTRPNGDYCDSCSVNGVTAVGECCYIGPENATAQDVFESFQENDRDYYGQGHRRAMISKSYAAIGIACVKINGRSIWTQEYGEKNSNASATTAYVGTKTGTVSVDISDAVFSIDFDDTFTHLTYGDSHTLPEVKGYYTCNGAYSSFHIPVEVPSSEVTDVSWKSSNTSVLTVTGNSAVTAVGVGSATLTASAKFGGKTYTCDFSVTVTTRSISDSSITRTVSTVCFDPNGAQPKPTITFNGKTLIEGTDYTITRYSGNTSVNANAYVYVSGKGNFTGSASIVFQILPRDISECAIAANPSVNYAGEETLPDLTLTFNGVTLTKGTHYTVSCSDNAGPGTATVIISGKGNYTGSRTESYTIIKQTADNLTYSSISDRQYSGSAITPSLTIKNGKTTLIQDTDYTLAYSNNTSTGEAAITVSFLGYYTGTKVLNFNIVPKPISYISCSVSAKTYTGSAVTQTLSLWNGSEHLVEGTDYLVTYKDNVNVGTATMTLTGKGNYKGTADYTFSIKPVNASSVTCTTDIQYSYTGSAIIPKVNIKYGDLTFKENVDYTLTFSNNIVPGQGTINITGISTILTGTATKYFTIGKADAANLSVEDIPVQTYTGTNITPAVVVKFGSTELVKGTDYTVGYSDNKNAGKAKATITGKGYFTGSKTVEFTIDPKTFGTLDISSISNYSYTGRAACPVPTVMDGSRQLNNNTDYTLSYKNNINAGSATVIISGIGNYKGTAEASFTIVPASISNYSLSVIEDQCYTGSELKPAVTVSSGTKTLAEGTDYTVSYTNNIDVGTGVVTVTGTGNYTGSRKTTFSIIADSSNVTVDEIADRTYNGSSHTPSIIVRFGNKVLIMNTDYTVSITENINVGTAKVVINLKGKYSGTKNASFNILPRSIGNATVSSISDQAYTGSMVTPSITVKDYGNELVRGTDYTIEYKNNTAPGTATATITGIGNYTGSRDVTFKIVAGVSDVSIEPIADQTYCGSSLTPSVTVKSGTKELVKGTDYTVSYSDNTNVGTATVTVTLRGSYSGTKYAEFNILPRAISNATVLSISNQTYTGNAIEPDVIVRDTMQTLVKGTHFTVAYANNINVGTATVTVTGIGNYSGSVTASFEIVAGTLDFTIATIANQEYTGSAITPDVVVKSGTKELKKGTDYTVAYSDNTNAGTAKVTITLKGSYTGSKTATFTIEPRSISKATIIADQTYTGSAIKPSVTVKDNGKDLTSGKDYSVTYSNNVNAGNATATVKGIGNYNDSVAVSFTIVKKTDPVNPTDPTDPTDPTNPTDPINPTDPTDPTDPTNPTDPDDPNEPEEKPVVTYRLKKIKGKYYCISSATGKKVKGWRTINGKTYFFNKKTGVMTKGWKKIGGKKYYFSKSGVMTKGWKKIKGKKYYFGSNGVMAKGWKTINGHRYYFSKSGVMAKGWKKIGKYKYHFTSSGIMHTGWKKIHKKWYYFYSNGRMVKNKTIEIDGIKYKFKKSGVCTRKPVTTAPPASTAVNNEAPPQTETQVNETPVTETPVTEPNGAAETPVSEPA